MAHHAHRGADRRRLHPAAHRRGDGAGRLLSVRRDQRCGDDQRGDGRPRGGARRQPGADGPRRSARAGSDGQRAGAPVRRRQQPGDPAEPAAREQLVHPGVLGPPGRDRQDRLYDGPRQHGHDRPGAARRVPARERLHVRLLLRRPEHARLHRHRLAPLGVHVRCADQGAEDLSRRRGGRVAHGERQFPGDRSVAPRARSGHRRFLVQGRDRRRAGLEHGPHGGADRRQPEHAAFRERPGADRQLCVRRRRRQHDREPCDRRVRCRAPRRRRLDRARHGHFSRVPL